MGFFLGFYAKILQILFSIVLIKSLQDWYSWDDFMIFVGGACFLGWVYLKIWLEHEK